MNKIDNCDKSRIQKLMNQETPLNNNDVGPNVYRSNKLLSLVINSHKKTFSVPFKSSMMLRVILRNFKKLNEKRL